MSQNKKTWYFFDIDGCVMPSIFPNNQFYTTNEEKLKIIIEAYKKANANILFNYNWEQNTILYEYFIEFFKVINNNVNNYITFITGRQYTVFGWLTQWQLELLGDSLDIRYFNDYETHSKESYKTFKIKSIRDFVSIYSFHGDIKVYDDNDSYFKDLTNELNTFLDLKCKCYLAKSNEDWKLLLENLKKEVDIKKCQI